MDPAAPIPTPALVPFFRTVTSFPEEVEVETSTVELCVSVTPSCTPTITPCSTVVDSILVGVMRRLDDDVAEVVADDEVMRLLQQ